MDLLSNEDNKLQQKLKNFLQTQAKPFSESAPSDITSDFSEDIVKPTEIGKKTFHGTYIGQANIVGELNGKIILRSSDNTSLFEGFTKLGVEHGPSRTTKLCFSSAAIKQTEGSYKDGKRVGTWRVTKHFLDEKKDPIETVYEV